MESNSDKAWGDRLVTKIDNLKLENCMAMTQSERKIKTTDWSMSSNKDICTHFLWIQNNANITPPEIICIGECDIIWSMYFHTILNFPPRLNRTELHRQNVNIQHPFVILFLSKLCVFLHPFSMLTAASIKHSKLPEYGNSAEVLVCDTLKRWNYTFWNFI